MERKLSKKMPSNSRPPLTSRIRASFDGKRSKSEVTSPTIASNGFITQQPDPDLFQKAVDHAMNSAAFQDAISANLAKLLKPTIKSALDTIQPVVETVYNHEVLLRQTNKSVENLLERLDTVSEAPESDFGDPQTPTPATPRRRTLNLSSSTSNIEALRQILEESNAQTFAKLSELSGSVETSNIKIAEALDGISGINAILYPTREGLDSVKSISEQAHTATSVIQAQLDQLSQDVGTILDAIWKDLNRKNKAPDSSLFSEHTSKLDAISSSLATLKGNTDTTHLLQNIAGNIEILKDNIHQNDASYKDNFAVTKPQFDAIVTSVEAQSDILADIKAALNPSREILDAVKKSNDSHAAHAVVLNQIQDKCGNSGIEPAVGSNSPDPETAEALRALQADLTSLKENIVTGIATSHDDIAGIGTKVEDVLVTLEAHRASDPGAEILAEVKRSNESHGSHSSALEGIRSINLAAVPSNDSEGISILEPKIASIIAILESHTASLDDLHSSHSSALEGIKSINAGPTSASDNDSISSLESQIATVISTLESHTIALHDLKASTPESNPGALDAMESNITSMVSLLEANSTTLNEIKDDVSAEILTILNEHSSVLSEIKESDVSEEILTSINDSHATHTATLTDIHTSVNALNVTHSSHAKGLDEPEHTGDTEPATMSDTSGIKTQISAIMSTLEEQNVVLSTIKEAAVTHIDSLGGHAAALAEIKEATHSTKAIQESHEGTLAELKGALTTSVDSHANHSKALAELKAANLAANDLHASHITSLSELKSIQPAPGNNGVDVDSLQSNFNSIISSLDIQATTLSEIKAAAANLEVLTTVKDSQELLQTQSSLLKSIKDADAHDDIIANISSLKSIIEESRAEIGDHGASVKDLHESTKASHSDLTQAIAALAIGGGAGAGASALISKDGDDSTELLNGVNAIREIVEKSSTSIEALRETTSSTAVQIDTHHATITTSITTMTDEIKSEIDATGTEITDSLTTLGGDVKNIDSTLIDTIVPNVLRHSAALNDNGSVIKNISSSLNVLHGSVQETGEHVVSLKDVGLHLNDSGIDQLKEHAILSARKHSFSAQRTGDKETWWKKPETGGPTASVFAAQDEEDSMKKLDEPSAPAPHISKNDEQATETEADIEEPILASIREESEASGSIGEAPVIEKSVPVEYTIEDNAETPSSPNIKHPDDEKIEIASTAVDEPAVEEEEPEEIGKVVTEENDSPSAAGGEHAPKLVSEPEEKEPSTSKVDDEGSPSTKLELSHADLPEDYSLTQFSTSPIAEEASPTPIDEHTTPLAPTAPVNDLPDSPKSAIFSPVEASESSPTEESGPTDEPLTSPVFSDDTESAATSAIASPMSPSFPEKSGKGGKKGKKEKKEKKGKKDKKAQFVFDPDEEEGAAA